PVGEIVAEGTPWVAEIDGEPAGTMTLTRATRPIHGRMTNPGGSPGTAVRARSTAVFEGCGHLRTTE
ncbi:hypothetical protein ACFVBQ_34700, partial [Streptomyces sp. NPDC057675]